MTEIVTLWQANESFKVLRPSGFEIYFSFFQLRLKFLQKNICRQNNEILFFH